MKNIFFSFLLFVQSIIVTRPVHALNDLELLEVQSVLEEKRILNKDEIQFLLDLSQETKSILDNPLWQNSFQAQWKEFMEVKEDLAPLDIHLNNLTFSQLSLFIKAFVELIEKYPNLDVTKNELEAVISLLDPKNASLIATGILKIINHFKNEIKAHQEKLHHLRIHQTANKKKLKEIEDLKTTESERKRAITLGHVLFPGGAQDTAHKALATVDTVVSASSCAPCCLGSAASGCCGSIPALGYTILMVIFLLLGVVLFATFGVSFPSICGEDQYNVRDSNGNYHCYQLQPFLNSSAIDCLPGMNSTLPLIDTTLNRTLAQLLNVTCIGSDDYSLPAQLYQTLLNTTSSCFNATGTCTGISTGLEPQQPFNSYDFMIWASVYFPLIFTPTLLACLYCFYCCGCYSIALSILTSWLVNLYARHACCLIPPSIVTSAAGSCLGLAASGPFLLTRKVYQVAKKEVLEIKKQRFAQQVMELETINFIGRGLSADFLEQEENLSLTEFLSKLTFIQQLFQQAINREKNKDTVKELMEP